MTLFRGLSAFPITPTDKAGVVDPSALAVILDRIQEADADSIGLLGSTGGGTRSCLVISDVAPWKQR